MDYTFQFGDVFAHAGELFAGARLTLILSGGSMLVGLAVAVLLAVTQTSGPKAAVLAIRIYVEIIRNTPFLIQIWVVFFLLPLAGIRLDPNWAGFLAMVVYVSAYSTEIVRAGIESVPRGLIDAGRALGLSFRQILRLIVLPRALRTVYPSLTSQFILVMLSSSVLSAIATEELTAVASNIDSVTFRSVEVYLVVAGMYFGLSMIFAGAFALVGRLAFPPLPMARA